MLLSTVSQQLLPAANICPAHTRSLERSLSLLRSFSIFSAQNSTHERFTRRHRGTYGPAGNKEPGDLDFLGPSTPFAPNFKLCGDSCFPGIGVPSAAASGIIAAHCFVPLAEHQALLETMQREGTLCVGRGWWDAANGESEGTMPHAKAMALESTSREGNAKRPSPPLMTTGGGRISMLCESNSPSEYTTPK